MSQEEIDRLAALFSKKQLLDMVVPEAKKVKGQNGSQEKRKLGGVSLKRLRMPAQSF